MNEMRRVFITNVLPNRSGKGPHLPFLSSVNGSRGGYFLSRVSHFVLFKRG